jgi:predicted GH43/DUF377 family glycosyl hydrolase
MAAREYICKNLLTLAAGKGKKRVMKWTKRGFVYAPDGSQWWARSYATIPTVEVLDDNRVRVYFASVDEHKHGRIGFVEVDPRSPQKILRRSAEPVLDIGAPGTFDDSGVNPSCIVVKDGVTLLYYIGWQRAERVPYMLFAGLAQRNGQDRFERVQRVPVLDRTDAEPFLRSATSVLHDGVYKGWYVSGDSWTEVSGRPVPQYRIRYAESSDGIDWSPQSGVCIDFENQDEYGFGRPWVLKDGALYRMWYSIRSRSAPYRLGYAESADGLSWVRKDSEVGISKSETGWDSEMICYPCVVDAGGNRYMFYNGNQHGSTGFGCAVLD